MRLGLLGPLEVWVGEREVPIAGARLRALLCRLAVEPGRRVSTPTLADAVWPDGAPADSANALQSLISRLRRALGAPAAITQELTGYRLAIELADLDATVLSDRLASARRRRTTGDLEGAEDDLNAGLALWRGEPLSDAGEADYAQGYRARWISLHRAALRERLDLALLRGTTPALLVELIELVDANPLDESLVAQLMRALVTAGRNAEALARFEQTRRYLADELGADPSRELQELHLELLRAADAPRAEPRHSVGEGARSNLRSWLTSFVGREVDVQRVLTSVAAHRLTTVVGPGGAGKTRLATEVAARWLDDNDATAWLIELAPVTEESNIATAILGALGLRDTRVLERPDRPPQDTMERLIDLLRDSDSLLVIDNCEHLIESAASVIDRLLANAPQVRVLTTSREPLSMLGEAVVALPTLSLPPVGADLRQAREAAAVSLWLDRARTVRPDFQLDTDTLAPVIDIVRRLDGLPLAIELAAAKLRVLPLPEIARRLSDRFRLLTGGNRAALPRHRTLRAVVEWSWDLLSRPERLLAERLAVFPAGADLASAEAICADDRLPADDIDAALMSLVDKSLLQVYQVPGAGPPVRFRMLETIREYGMERLAERGELEEARLAHARYFSQLVLTLEPVVRSGQQLAALHTLDLERENVLAGLRFLGDSGRGPEALHLCLALVWYWSLLNSTSEAITWLRFVIEVNQELDPPELVFARAALALAEITADPGSDRSDTVSAQAAPTTTESGASSHQPADARPAGDWAAPSPASQAIAEALLAAPAAPFPGLAALIPMFAHFAGRLDIAAAVAEKSIQSSDRWLRAAVQTSTALAAENDSDLDLMRATASAAYQEFVDLGDRWGMSSCLLVRARLATLEGRTVEAVADLEEAGRHLAALGGSTDDETYIRIRLADLYARSGDFAAARRQVDFSSADSTVRRSFDTELFSTATLASLDWLAGDLDAAAQRSAQLRAVLDSAPTTAGSFRGHRVAIVLGISGLIAAERGDLTQAATDLDQSYRAALATADLPILASVGMSIVVLALARGQVPEAAEILGATAQIRGADDPTDPTVARLTARIRARLEDFDAWYERGWSLSRAEAIARLDPAAEPRPTPPDVPAAGAQARLR